MSSNIVSLYVQKGKINILACINRQKVNKKKLKKKEAIENGLSRSQSQLIQPYHQQWTIKLWSSEHK